MCAIDNFAVTLETVFKRNIFDPFIELLVSFWRCPFGVGRRRVV